MWNIYYIMVQRYVIRMELMVDLTENKSASMHSPQCFQLLWGDPLVETVLPKFAI